MAHKADCGRAAAIGRVAPAAGGFAIRPAGHAATCALPPMPNVGARAQIGSPFGDPARVRMLCRLAGGVPLSAKDLADCAGMTPQTASGHIAKLVAASLVSVERLGGTLGAAILRRGLALDRVRLRQGSRSLTVTHVGSSGVREVFGVRLR